MTVFMKEMILEKVVFFMRGKSVVHHFVTIRLSYIELLLSYLT